MSQMECCKVTELFVCEVSLWKYPSHYDLGHPYFLCPFRSPNDFSVAAHVDLNTSGAAFTARVCRAVTRLNLLRTEAMGSEV